jgi:peptide/nickel transport system substrate-binding protein
MAVLALATGAAASPSGPLEERLIVPGLTGRSGGRLVYTERTEPKTLNPVFASDSASKDVIHLLNADLVHIDRATLATRPELAKSCRISADGLHYNVELRQGLRFSDGHPFDADDVIFTFQVYLDEKVDSSQRNLWVLDGKPIRVRKLGSYRVVFDLPRVNAVGERIFDSVPMLPRHLLEAAYREGRLQDAWGLRTAPNAIAGLGPFRLKQYVPGQRVVLERNPSYWKSDPAGNRLPYLAELVFTLAGTEDMAVMRLQSGEADLISRISARNYTALAKQNQRRGYVLADAGPGFEYSFLIFNLNDLPSDASASLRVRQPIWRRAAFRKAVSAAIDRDAIVRLVYQGYADALGSLVAAGNKPWIDAKLPPSRRSLSRARELLAGAGFKWTREGSLVDPDGKPAGFSILVSSTNSERAQMATLIQADLKPLGVAVDVVPLEFNSLLERINRTHDYEAAIGAITSTDADPTADLNVWLSSGNTHLWNPLQRTPATPWEAEVDRLTMQQMVTPDHVARKRVFDRAQEIVMENMPLVPLVTPHLLIGARRDLGNFRAAALDPYAMSNVEELYWRKPAGPSGAAR